MTNLSLRLLLHCRNFWTASPYGQNSLGLTLNPDKSKYMIIASPKRTISNMSPIVLNGHALQFVDKLLLLGVTVSSSLSWTAYINNVRCKMTGRLNVARRFRRILNASTRRIVYNAFIRPHLEYCLPVWGNCTTTDCHAMDCLLTKCTKFLYGKQHIDSVNDITNSCSPTNFKNIVLLHNMRLMFSFIHSTCHNLNIDLITHSYSTRGSQSFKLSLHKFNFSSTKLSFYGTVPRQWNQLPNNVSIITDLNKFLQAIRHIDLTT